MGDFVPLHGIRQADWGWRTVSPRPAPRLSHHCLGRDVKQGVKRVGRAAGAKAGHADKAAREVVGAGIKGWLD
jgi:hypothetical protein